MMTTVRANYITCLQTEFSLRLAFTHNLAERTTVSTILVRVADEGKNAGWGQALPRNYLTGETIDSCLQDLTTHWPQVVEIVVFPRLSDKKGESTAHVFLDSLLPLYEQADNSRKNASYSAFEIALVDHLCRVNNIEGGSMWGSPPGTVPLVGVIPAMGARKSYWLARLLKFLGYNRFKVKVGKDEAADAMRLEAVRKAVGSSAWLAVDANAAWDAEEACRRIAGLRKYSVALAEEPLAPAAKDILTLGELEKKTGMAIMADESICTLADAECLLTEGSPSWWNLRIGKNGGFSGLRALSRKAAEANVKLYGGVLVGELSCLAAAGRAAMGLVGYECMEYGFPRVFVKGDPFRGGPGGYRGTATPLKAGRVGLGVTKIQQ
jgi:L-alanine-DL-glutamate epimerase and related enzymes of enolase superfamily